MLVTIRRRYYFSGSAHVTSISAACIASLLLLGSCGTEPPPPPKTPIVNSISSSQVYRLTPFTLSGENFSDVASENIVAFDSSPITVLGSTTTEITAMVPEDFPFGTYVVSVTVNSLTGELGNPVEVTSFKLTGISPVSGSKGTPVTISGVGFGPQGSSYQVTFNGKETEVLSSSATEIHVKVPQGAGTGVVSVTYLGVTVNGPTFNYILTKGYEASAMETVVSASGLAQAHAITYDSINKLLYTTGGQGIRVVNLTASTISDMTITGLGSISLKQILHLSGNLYALGTNSVLKIAINGLQGTASTIYTTTCCTLDALAHYQGTVEIAGYNPQLASSFYVTVNSNGTTSMAPGGDPQAVKAMAIDPANGRRFLAFGSSLVYTLISPTPTSKVLDGQVRSVTCDLMGNGFWITQTGRLSMYDPRLETTTMLFSNTNGVDLVAHYQSGQVRIYLLDTGMSAIRTFTVSQVMN